MKKPLISAISLAALTGTTFAADLPSRKDQVVTAPPPPMWTGLYAGVNIGGGWTASGTNNNTYNQIGMNSSVTSNIGSGVVGGVQGGYNYQIGSGSLNAVGSGMVIGLETDFQGTSMATTPSSFPTCSDPILRRSALCGSFGRNGAGLPWFGTVRGRAGILAMPTLLIYGTGGFAYGLLNQDGWYSSTSTTQTGWTAGGGAEWMFMPNWSAKVEYLYSSISGGRSYNWVNLGLDANYVNIYTRWNTVRAGVNYHFNFASAPVVAKF